MLGRPDLLLSKLFPVQECVVAIGEVMYAPQVAEFTDVDLELPVPPHDDRA